MTHPAIPLSELREHYPRADLARFGISFDRAIQDPATRWGLEHMALAHRATAARQAKAAAIPHQVREDS